MIYGDIRLPNLCATPSRDAFIVDFSHASKSNSPRAKADEVEELRRILRAGGMRAASLLPRVQ